MDHFSFTRQCHVISHTEGLFTRADFQIPKNLKNAAQISSIWVYPSLPCEFGQHGSVSLFARLFP